VVSVGLDLGPALSSSNLIARLGVDSNTSVPGCGGVNGFGWETALVEGVKCRNGIQRAFSKGKPVLQLLISQLHELKQVEIMINKLTIFLSSAGWDMCLGY
jgi:hypothetical protein